MEDIKYVFIVFGIVVLIIGIAARNWKKILRGITVEDAIRCEGYHEDLKNGFLSKKEVEEMVYQISLKYS